MTSAERERNLCEWLATQRNFGPGTEVLSLTPLAGGQSSELLSLTCRRRPDGQTEQLVVRLEQRGTQLFLTPDIVREHRVIDSVAKHSAVPVPQMEAVEPRGAVLGVPFLIMRHVEGRAPLGKPSMHVQGLLTELSAVQRQRVAFSGIDAMAVIHTIDWRRTHAFLHDSAAAGKGIDRHLQRLAEWYRWAAAGREFPITDAALDYLVRHRTALHDEEDVLLWGDARPGNILYGPNQTVAAVLDWEGAFIGPRSLDVGYWVMMDLFHAEKLGISRLPGWPDEANVLARYRSTAETDVYDLDYFVVLGAFFISTTLIRAVDIAVEAGRLAPDTRMAHANTATQIAAERLGMRIPPLSPDFNRHRGLPEDFTGLGTS
jgi:aminoglycoside phosphotransferase (APT) family kinase protein